MSVPSLHLVIELEGSPSIRVEASSEGEEIRLLHWLDASPLARELLELAKRWQEAA